MGHSRVEQLREACCLNFGDVTRPGNLRKNSTRTKNVEVARRPWCDLPADLLSLIADGLSMTDIVSFRCVCKDWQTAASVASAKREAFPKIGLLLLFYGENSKCHLYHDEERRYTMIIPELDGATCIASNQGWLLVFKEGSMFFFCPFTRAKIDIPKFPHSVLSEHASAFSFLPTSPECIVVVMRRDPDRGLGLYLLHRGDITWTRIEVNKTRYEVDAFRIGTCENQTFLFFDEINGFVTSSTKGKSYIGHTHVLLRKPHSSRKDVHSLSLEGLFPRTRLWQSLVAGDDVSGSVCVVAIPIEGFQIIISGVELKAAESSESQHLKGVWIKPRFYQMCPNQSW